MKGDFLRRLDAAEGRLREFPIPALQDFTPTPELWALYASYQACLLLAVFEPAGPDIWSQLYAAICAGNARGDSSGPYRADFRGRFDWAVYDASSRCLGSACAGRWIDALRTKIGHTALDHCDAFRDEIPVRCPELLVRGEDGARRPVARYWVERGTLWSKQGLARDSRLAAFAIDAWRPGARA